jgi:hypothetical protein
MEKMTENCKFYYLFLGNYDIIGERSKRAGNHPYFRPDEKQKKGGELSVSDISVYDLWTTAFGRRILWSGDWL